ncbi:uncharacterized protein GLRG_11071 [Colletotrichum graminicola M1.001]|uniref:Uncharacterized protein n=1 Tax=Colletotrichum graminicola (strain M1.001 / M2 / FGSC 10212) TaxID=645133 RepID=E3QYE2_COLGM|nr:uncharacterized protein GLRG_11071 [Colletotrichum graminicola M1.001]EFQ35880.1 hypothetical protein GLRG_11071 [Colletotrichum graminicola M1.001]
MDTTKDPIRSGRKKAPLMKTSNSLLDEINVAGHIELLSLTINDLKTTQDYAASIPDISAELESEIMTKRAKLISMSQKLRSLPIQRTQSIQRPDSLEFKRLERNIAFMIKEKELHLKNEDETEPFDPTKHDWEKTKTEMDQFATDLKQAIEENFIGTAIRFEDWENDDCDMNDFCDAFEAGMQAQEQKHSPSGSIEDQSECEAGSGDSGGTGEDKDPMEMINAGNDVHTHRFLVKYSALSVSILCRCL